MDNQAYYVYAFTWAGGAPAPSGPGVDGRYQVELVSQGGVAALASHVGLDEFDLAKLQPPSADVDWVSRVALRHNEIIAEAAQSRPVLPLRMGTLFQSSDALLAKLSQFEKTIRAFLEELGDRQEWAAKIYLDPQGLENDRPGSSLRSDGGVRGSGVQYLVRQRMQAEARRAARGECRNCLAAVEAALRGCADRTRRLDVLPNVLTRRREKMLWNAAFLVSRSCQEAWLERTQQWQRDLRERGLLLEVTGPWPPYHFCPE